MFYQSQMRVKQNTIGEAKKCNLESCHFGKIDLTVNAT